MSSAKQTRINLLFNVLSLIANILVGIFYTPYLVKSLGVVAYGVLPLALIINQYISVLTGSLTSALTRFYSIALRQNKIKEASKYLSTSLFVVFILIILLFYPLSYFINHIDNYFNIPFLLLNDSKKLFTFTIISFFISLITSVLNITLYAYNRLDLLNIIKIIRVLGKLLFVLIFFNFFEVNIEYIGLANFVTELIVLIVSIYFFYNFSVDKVRLIWNGFDKSILVSVGSMAMWIIVQQLGDTGLYRIDNLIVNKFWTTKESGILGAFTELGNYTIIIASVISSLFGPLILIAYAKNDNSEMKRLTIDRSLGVGILVSVMIGILGGFSPIILNVWLGEEFVPYYKWLMIKLFLIPFYSSAGVFAFSIRALNKVKFTAILTVSLGLINILLAYLIAYFNRSENAIELILLLGIILGIIQSYFLNGLYFANFYKGTYSKVLINSIKILLTITSIYFLGFIITPFFNGINNILSLIYIFIIGIILLAISFKIMLSKEQINEMISLIYKKK
ncbi:hypothetical protein [Empedobacter sp. 189-2]|uniref:hypothetical protein n=1 Tax=Empedobacter sp. 189-2 TaxID=2746724 RepID=UPI0025770608|nr:hypothetical protein [Empedobacter sp. 189-2]MDM1541806.1 hypothetical protein [Empedobacter sp. 189-2]